MAFSTFGRELFLTRFNRMERKNRSRKNRSRKNRSRTNRNRKNRMLYGGMAPLSDTSMNMAQRDSLAQGSQYLNIHKDQHGGAAAYPTAVTNSVLTGPMIAATRTGPLDTAIAQIQGMQDGGRRRSHSSRRSHSRSRKGKKHSRRSHSRSKKHRSRRHRGGAHSGSNGAPLSGSSMLLPAGLDKQAALHHEWADAKNPNAFVPRQ